MNAMPDPIIGYYEPPIPQEDWPKYIETKEINQILRGEIAATESYEQALEVMADEPIAETLREFYRDHHKVITYWRKEVDGNGLTPEQKSGIWGLFVEGTVGFSRFFGYKATLKTLKFGEEHGLRVYIDFLNNEHTSQRHREFVQKTVLPSIEKHIYFLDQLLRTRKKISTIH